MKCPKCGSETTRTADSRPTAGGLMIRRRRVCRDCRFRWSTLEAPIGDPALLIEACGLIEPFQAVQAASRHLAETLAAIEPTDPD